MPRHFVQEPWPIQQISDAGRVYEEPADFRTPGEKRRDERRAEAGREVSLEPPLGQSPFPPPEGGKDTPESPPIAGSFGRAARRMLRHRNLMTLMLKEMFKRLPHLEEKYGDKGRFVDALIATT